MANNDKFRAAIAKRIAKTKGKFELFVQKLALAIDESIIYKSPVDTGRFRANWMIGNGSINHATSGATDLSGGNTIASHQTLISNLKVNGQVIYITNSLPYAHRLEYEGWSRQAPAGMVRITIAELDSLIKQAGVEVKAL